MLTVLGGLAEFERHLILARTTEDRHRAQRRGVKFGRKPKLTLHQQQEAIEPRAQGEALVDIARSYAVSSGFALFPIRAAFLGGIRWASNRR
jgi:DNA invertase Pin-like site-specific DNA recombinase